MKNFKKEDLKEMSSVLALSDDWDDYLLEAKMRRKTAKKAAAKRVAAKRALRKKAMKKLAEAYHYLALLEQEGKDFDILSLSPEQVGKLIEKTDAGLRDSLRPTVNDILAKAGFSDEEKEAFLDQVIEGPFRAFMIQTIALAKETKKKKQGTDQGTGQGTEQVIQKVAEKEEGFFKKLWNKVVSGFKFLGRPFAKIAEFVKKQWKEETHQWWRRIGIIIAALALVALLIIGRRRIWAFLKFLGRIAKRGFDAVKNFFARIFGRKKSTEEIRSDIDNIVSLYDM